MALQSSGQISLANIAAEFGGTQPHQLSEYYGVAAGVPSSGAISISDFYGASNVFAFTISSNQTNASLSTLATNAGWDGSSAVQATINSGVYISSSSTGTPALTISGISAGVTLINNGYIIGKGGNGGAGSPWNGSAGGGGAGGGALSVSNATTITNNGTIAGGGNGGNGGGKGVTRYISGEGYIGAGGGGGGGGRSSNGYNTSGGGGGSSYSGGSPSEFWHGSSGSGGTVNGAGSGGGGGYVRLNNYSSSGGAGAAGGNWGGGYAVSGNSNITWSATGTRLGAIS